MAIHQAKQHSGTRRLADGARNSGHRDLIELFDIHILMISESWLFRQW